MKKLSILLISLCFIGITIDKIYSAPVTISEPDVIQYRKDLVTCYNIILPFLDEALKKAAREKEPAQLNIDVRSILGVKKDEKFEDILIKWLQARMVMVIIDMPEEQQAALSDILRRYTVYVVINFV